MQQVFFENLFPSTVLYSDFNKPSISLVNFSRDFIKEHGNIPFYSPCISTVHAKRNVLELPEFAEIKQHIIGMIDVYCQNKKINQENLAIVDAWLNLYNEHSYQDLHHHPDSLLSGIYYIQSTGEKDLSFQTPYYFAQPCFPNYNELSLDNCFNVEYHSIAGRCMIFMSHLMHRTFPAKSERISLSFNVKYI